MVESSAAVPPCPKCKGDLKPKDRRMRIRKKEGGSSERLSIRRFECSQCQSCHNELPDCLVPYKHYETEVISGVLDGVITPEDKDAEDYPCTQTMRRWFSWFKGNRANIEGHLRKAASSIMESGDEILLSMASLLDRIRKKHQDWLEMILRIIYNTGGFLPSQASYPLPPALFWLSKPP